MTELEVGMFEELMELRAENERLRGLGKEVVHDSQTLSQNNMDLRKRNAKLEKVAEAAVDVIDGCPYKGVLDFPELRAALDDWRNNDSI